MNEPSDHVAEIQSEWRRERPDLDVSPQGIIGRLHRLGGFLTDELVSVYRAHGLGEGDFDVLATLRRAGEPFERTPGELAQFTMVTTGAMTKRVDRLVDAGLVTRRQSDLDGRGRVVALTVPGRRLIDEAFTEHIANEHRLLAALDRDERSQLQSILAKWLGEFEVGGDKGRPSIRD
ncbi:MarR family winged helix-turn-helix transcriptional regulator [Mycetocola zhadangensis]|uniref:MarR family transcriptional regulator n=1 Tax=Mycetocola zhadangensis TaxID=1164595 RepID=A0A3L7J5F8_9MICO|nr:MarR family transcriptional regulator [Mycetocola zhadangensis]RLQ85689.1 MarR family transcriptional regulator [Mycetocola zhadangensis]GGE84851.1 MarR family transcriptional regulator [Mycetocola zhadangensis]